MAGNSHEGNDRSRQRRLSLGVPGLDDWVGWASAASIPLRERHTKGVKHFLFGSAENPRVIAEGLACAKCGRPLLGDPEEPCARGGKCEWSKPEGLDFRELSFVAFDVTERRRVVERVIVCPYANFVVYEQPLGGGWHVAATFVLADGELAVAEIKTFPDATRSTSLPKPDRVHPVTGYDAAQLREVGWVLAGHWVHDENALRGVDGGVQTAAILRRVKVAELQARAAEWVHYLATTTTPSGRMTDRLVDLDSPVRRPGRAGRPDRHYAIWADRYVKAGGSLIAMASEYGESKSHIRDQIHEARARKLLSGGGKERRKGGTLTEKGIAALNASDQQERK